MGDVEETREGTHPVSEERPQDRSPSTNIVTSTEETPETHLKVVPERNLTQVDPQEEFKGLERQVGKMQ